MKAIVALILLGVVALSYAGFVSPAGFGYNAAVSPLAYPYAYTADYAGYGGYAGYGYNTVAGDYQLKLDTTLPGSAYASYPYAAAPTAYGYGVIKAL